MASSSHVPLSWKRKPGRASFTRPKARSRSAGQCWRRRRHNRRATCFRNCRSVRRRCRRTTSMPHRFYHLSFVITWLSVAGLACALASPRPSSAAQSKSREGSAQTSRPSTLVVIDAGHGGFDRGGIHGQRIAEKDMTLDVALRLRKKLLAAGYRVVMTRDSDVFVPLPGRVAIANSNRDAIFICIHFNSATRTGANGVETYYYRRDAMALAANIHRNVIAGAPSENRGIRRRGYYVLRKTTSPGVLVECGFLTNPAEGQLALTSDYRDKLAQEITAEFWANLPWSRARRRHATTLRPRKRKLSRSIAMSAPISSKYHRNAPLRGIGKDRQGHGARNPRITGPLRKRKAAAARRQKSRLRKSRRTNWTRRF